jgi:phytoene desaturase
MSRVAIVGGGIGGMTTALLLANAGQNVTIFEKKNQLGGRLTYETNGRYTIDQGPTIVLLPDMIRQVLKEAEVDLSSLQLMPCEPLYKIHYADGTAFTKWRDLPKQLNELDRVFPGEKAQFLRFLSDMSHIYEYGNLSFLSQVFPNKKDFLSLSNLRFLLKSKAYKSVKDFLASYFKDPRLQEAYALQTLYIGGSPYATPAIYGLVSYSEHAFGIWYVKGGYSTLVKLLEQACVKKGIHILTNTEVERLTIAEKVCTGVVAGGKSFPFDRVVYNGDFPLLYNLLGKNLPEKKKKDFTASSGCLLIYLGVNKRWEPSVTHQFFLSDSFKKHMNQVFSRNKRLPDDPAFYVFNPAVIDDRAAPEGESVLYFLIPVPTGVSFSTEEVDRLVRHVLDKAEAAHFSGLQEAIEWQKIRTPEDAEREGLYQGGGFGVAPILSQSGGFRPQVSPFDIKGLYSVGASVHPGGGIPIVMQGARLLSQLLLKEMEA